LLVLLVWVVLFVAEKDWWWLPKVTSEDSFTKISFESKQGRSQTRLAFVNHRSPSRTGRNQSWTMAERLPSLQELQEACIDDLPRLLLRKVIEVAVASSSSLATQKAAAAKLLGQLDPHMVATAVQLYSVFHQKDSTKIAGLVSILQTIDDDTHHRFRDAFLETVADTSLLEGLKMIPTGGDVFPKKLRIVNTNVYARQHKFNLLVEESEGYSKFLFGAQQQMDDHIDTVMGTFSLDPNRCLDLLLNLLIHALRQQPPPPPSSHDRFDDWIRENCPTSSALCHDVSPPLKTTTAPPIRRMLCSSPRI
jgi:THO complex subunit 2 N-terminus